MTTHVVSGMKLFIGGEIIPAFAPLTIGDFAGQSWTEITNWFQIGDLTEQVSVAQRKNPGNVQHKIKTGEVTVEDFDLVCEHLPADPGQALLIIASDPDNQASYAFRLDDSDDPSNPTKRYLIGCVIARSEIHGKSDDPRRTRYTIAPNSNVIHVAAS